MRIVTPADLTEILYELRDKGFSAVDVAIKLGVSRFTVYAWINQTRYPHPSQLRKILRLTQSAGIALPTAGPVSTTRSKLAVGFSQSR